MIRLNRKGFTLVEIMIVVAIIALLAAIAIPNLLRARVNANQGAAVATLKSVVASAASFASANNGNYPANFVALTGATPPYLDATVAAAAGRQGYIYGYTQGTTAQQYWTTAVPATANVTGVNAFYADETGIICRSDAASTTPVAAHVTGSGCPTTPAYTQVQ